MVRAQFWPRVVFGSCLAFTSLDRDWGGSDSRAITVQTRDWFVVGFSFRSKVIGEELHRDQSRSQIVIGA